MNILYINLSYKNKNINFDIKKNLFLQIEYLIINYY